MKIKEIKFGAWVKIGDQCFEDILTANQILSQSPEYFRGVTMEGFRQLSYNLSQSVKTWKKK